MFGRLFIAAVFFTSLFILVYSGQWEHEEAVARLNTQSQLFAQIEAVHTPAASQLVDDMRAAFPNPSDANLASLRLLAQRVKADPSSAAKYTLAAKEAAQAKSSCHHFTSVVTGGDICGDVTPGLD